MKNNTKSFIILLLTFVFSFNAFCVENSTEKEKKSFDIDNSIFSLTNRSIYPCGSQPKQVLFSPDSKELVMPLLNGDGFQVFDMETRKIVKTVLPTGAKTKGYVEGLFIPEKNAFFVSQMSTGKIYEFSWPGYKYRREISVGGNWSKFMTWSAERELIAVSNWISNDVSIIEYKTGKVISKIKTGKAPRGLLFVNGGKSIITLAFEGGVIQQFNVDTGKEEHKIENTNSAMRHIVGNAEGTTVWISDMYYAKIYEVSLADFKIKKTWKVYYNPNTIDLYENRYLFVSCRGLNNPQDYTLRSPKNGQIYVIDTKTGEILNKFEGGNQPTGLDVSPSGKFFCFSNFHDDTIEIYSIEKK